MIIVHPDSRTFVSGRGLVPWKDVGINNRVPIRKPQSPAYTWAPVADMVAQLVPTHRIQTNSGLGVQVGASIVAAPSRHPDRAALALDYLFSTLERDSNELRGSAALLASELRAGQIPHKLPSALELRMAFEQVLTRLGSGAYYRVGNLRTNRWLQLHLAALGIHSVLRETVGVSVLEVLADKNPNYGLIGDIDSGPQLTVAGYSAVSYVGHQLEPSTMLGITLGSGYVWNDGLYVGSKQGAAK